MVLVLYKPIVLIRFIAVVVHYTSRRLMHMAPSSLDRNRRFRRDSSAIATLSPQETGPGHALSQPA